MKKLLTSFLFSFVVVDVCAGQITNSEIASRIANSFNGPRALNNAAYVTQFWRIGGGPGFDTCAVFIQKELQAFGFRRSQALLKFEVEEDPPGQPVWTPLSAELSMTSPEQRSLQSFTSTPLMLCKNSFPQELTGDLVYVKGGADEMDFERIDVAGRIVLCDAPPGAAFNFALSRGALGIISSNVPDYNTPELLPDLIADHSIPYDETRKSFGFKVSTRTARELQRLLTYTVVSVHVNIAVVFSKTPIKTVVAEISGTTHPEQRILVVAHLDHYKPGANDNASGSATALEMVRTLSAGIRTGNIPAPARTLTFLWVDEIEGTEFWMKRHSSELANVQSAFVMDMVGGNPAKTGGTFRIERMPDPAVIWMRQPDHHSGWGSGEWDRDKLKGSYLNDYFLSVVDSRSRNTAWKYDQNVFEGGSDHVPLLRKGIPSVLSWHFPDRFYHSSLDDIDKLSTAEMRNAGTVVGTAVLTLACGNEATAREALASVNKAALWRLENELSNSSVVLGESQTQDEEVRKETQKREREILEAWAKWYDEALESVLSIPVEPRKEFKEEVAKARQQLNSRFNAVLAALGL